MSIINRVTKVAFSVQQKLAGETLRIRRGATEVVISGVVRGRANLATTTGDGELMMETTTTTFMLPADRYTFGGLPVEPRRGDQFLDDNDVYDVLPIDNGSWEYVDTGKTTIRVHTVRRV